MGIHVWAFVGISAILIIAPGPDTVMVLKNAVVHGRASALATVLGISGGLLVWSVAASVGVAALIRASAVAFTVLKVLGAAYLAWLGIQAWRHARSPVTPSRAGAGQGSPAAGFRQGLASDLSNPKIAVFFTGLLPQFVSSRQSATAPLLILGLIYTGLSIVWLGSYSCVAARLADVLVRPWVKAAMDRVSGTVLIAFGVGLALQRR